MGASSSSPTPASCRCGSLKAQRRGRFVTAVDSKPVCPSGPRLRSPPPEAAALLAEHLLLARHAAVDHGPPSDDHGTPPAAAVVSQVHHARQKRSWDCGLTAALMILSGRDLEEGVDWARLRDEVGTESVWTIDLAHLLRRVDPSLRFVFCTQELGVNPSYENIAFYRGELAKDERRVQQLFLSAEADGIEAHKVRFNLRSVPLLNFSNCMALCCVCPIRSYVWLMLRQRSMNIVAAV